MDIYKTTLKKQLYDYLKKNILNGQIEPGSRVIASKLCKEFNISEAPLREAFNALENEGFIKITPYKGVIISKLSKKEICEMYEVRIILETYCLRNCFNRIDFAKITNIESKIEKISKYSEDDKIFLASDGELHLEIILASKNSFLIKNWEFIRSKINWVRLIYLDDHFIKKMVTEHLKLIKLIKEYKINEATKYLEKHILTGKTMLLEKMIKIV